MWEIKRESGLPIGVTEGDELNAAMLFHSNASLINAYLFDISITRQGMAWTNNDYWMRVGGDSPSYSEMKSRTDSSAKAGMLAGGGVCHPLFDGYARS